ncbi:NAD(+) diphosphatase [Niveispirillum fermenti]|uniref:NAD(+) diphosphatase n=1 Tax=Niveispirillum fermenti TaxID=1233113 RepID=UPI0040428D23
MMTPNFYTGSGLDRSAHRRKDAQWLADRLRQAPASRIIPWWRGQHLVTGPDEAPQPAFLPADATWWTAHLDMPPLYLGDINGFSYFAVDLSPLEDAGSHGEIARLGRLVELRSLGMRIDRHLGGIYAYIRALLLWHGRHQFCGACGSPTEAADAGHSRRCTSPACGISHFPRHDPAVIMLVHDGGDRCLLGRQSRFPPGMYSTLAGFVEPGESLEETVARECMEEAGVPVTDIRYHSSQPWPFPASLMLGFHARATGFDVRPDQEELEDVRWFSRDYILNPPPGDEFRLPPRDSISRQLISSWLRG